MRAAKLNRKAGHSRASHSKRVTIVEMGLRDGLQNESMQLPVDIRVQLAKKLVDAGVRRLELGAFVRADWVPQMASSSEVITKVYKLQKEKAVAKLAEFSALVPNMTGFELAMGTPVREVAVFASASESFSIKNINCTIEESFERFVPVFEAAHKRRVKVRGYLSTCFGCPYEGSISEAKVVRLAKRLFKMGCYEISIGDTIGVAHPGQVQSLFSKLKKELPVLRLAGHFHDTRGTALVNILTAYQMGIRVFDSSVGGLGGCPYAPGSAGNVATEDVIYMFNGLKVKTNIDLQKMIDISHWVGQQMGKELPSKVSRAGLLRPKSCL